MAMTHRLAWFTAAATMILLVAGSLVTSTSSGDAVPDWWFVPISFGKLLPPMTGGVLYEHGHRLVASAVGIITIVLAVALWRDPRSWVRRLGIAAVAAVSAQGILGGLRVHHVADPRLIAIVHACFAQVFFGLIVALATVTAPSWKTESPDPEPSPLPRWAALAAAAAFLQILLGAVRRHTGWGINVHFGFAFAVVALVILSASEAFRRGRFQKTASTAVLLLVVQLALGGWAYALVKGGFERSVHASKTELAAIGLHLAVGGLIYALALSLAIRARRVWGSGGEAAGAAAAQPAGAP